MIRVFAPFLYGTATQLFKEHGYELLTKEEANSSRPDFLLISVSLSVSPILSDPRTTYAGAHLERDYQELGMINSARLSGVPIVGVSRGLSLLGITYGAKVSSVVHGNFSLSHGLIDTRLNKFTPVLNDDNSPVKVPGFHVNYMELGDAEEVFDEIWCDSDYHHAEIVIDVGKRIIGFQFNPFENNNISTDGCDLAFATLKSRLKDIL